MSSLSAYRTAIVEKLESTLGRRVKTVRAHPGGFDDVEMQRYFDRMPAVLVVCLGVQSIQRAGNQIHADVRMGLFVLTDGTRVDSRDEASLTLVDSLIRLVANERWLPADTQLPKSVSGDNRYSGVFDKRNVTLWLVTWNQVVTLSCDPEDTLAAFELMNLKVDLAPMDGTVDAESNIVLEQEETES